MIERHVICQNFRILSRMKCVICMSLQVNILCLICINCQYPKIALNLTMMHEFCSIFIGNTVKQGRSLTHVVSPDEIQHVRSKSECLLSECWREENISCKALGLWFLSLFQDPVRIGNTEVLPVKSVRDLGVYIDADVTMTAHVTRRSVVFCCFTSD